MILVLTLVTAVSQAREFPYRRQEIKKVEIEGNSAFSDRKLKRMMLTKSKSWYNLFSKYRLSRTNLILDRQQLERFYRQRGFLFAKAEAVPDFYPADSTKAVVKFSIDEGRRVYVDTVYHTGGVPSLNEQLRPLTQRIKSGEPVNNDMVQATALRIRDYYADNGYALASVKPAYHISADSNWAAIEFAIAESSLVIVSEIRIKQEEENKSTGRVIFREMTQKAGEKYCRKEIIDSQQRLYSTGLFKFVDIGRAGDLTQISGDTAATALEVKLSGRKSKFINLRLGIGQQEYFGALLSAMQTSAAVGSRNLFGNGRKVLFEVKNSFQIANRGEEVQALKFSDLFADLGFHPIKNQIRANYVEPWFFEMRVPFSFDAIYEIRTRNPIIDKYYDKLSIEPSLYRELDRFSNIRFSMRVEFVRIRGVSPQEADILRIEGKNTIRRRLAMTAQRDTRDNVFIPQRGSYSSLSLDYVGHYLGGDFSFIKGSVSWSRYRLLGEENILATRIKIGALAELGADKKSGTEDRFTLGGAKSLRGFGENALGPKWSSADGVTGELLGRPKGGKLLLLTNVELRRAIFWRFGGSVFLDAGETYYKSTEFKFKNIVSSSGLGLQFFTPIGPINFEYAFRLKRKLDLTDGSYHLTLLYAF